MRRLYLFGHPIHPPSTHIPLGLLLVVPLADAFTHFYGGAGGWRFAFWLLAVGLAAGLGAVSTGLMDYSSLENGHPGERDTVRHMVIMGSALLLDLGSLLARGGVAAPAGGRAILAVALSAVGSAVLGLGGWYGGQLVYHHKIGIK